MFGGVFRCEILGPTCVKVKKRTKIRHCINLCRGGLGKDEGSSAGAQKETKELYLGLEGLRIYN